MFCRVLVAIALAASSTYAQEREVTASDNKTQCISQMVQWCDGMKYSQRGAGMSMLSVTYKDSSGYYRVFCSSDSEGTNCTRNGQAWFACSPQNELTYNGNPLTAEADSKEVDDEICKTAEQALKHIFVQNLSYDNATLDTALGKGMESFFEQMAAMRQQIELMQKRLANFSMFSGDFWGGFGSGFPFNVDTGTEKSTTTTESNQIEKE